MPLSGATYAERVSSHDSTAKARILIAEDDPGVRTSLTRALTFQGYEVTAVNDGSQALESVTRSLPDAVILDVSMPHIDGLTACRMMREKHRHLPILMLTARHEVSDRVAGLDAGADDYVVKPFGLRELVARINAVMRRVGDAADDGDGPEELRAGRLVMSTRTHRVTMGDDELHLTPREFEILSMLMADPGAVVSRDDLLRRLWGTSWAVQTKAIDVHVSSLRRKLGDPAWVETVRGVGFRLGAPAA